jgi:hypothetical protein
MCIYLFSILEGAEQVVFCKLGWLQGPGPPQAGVSPAIFYAKIMKIDFFADT